MDNPVWQNDTIVVRLRLRDLAQLVEGIKQSFGEVHDGDE